MTYPYACIEEKVQGSDVTIIGVQHTPDFFYDNYQFLYNKIQNSDAVVLEQVVNAEFFNENGFFGPIAHMARFKPIYVVDPVNVGGITLDTFTGAAGALLMMNPLISQYSKKIQKMRMERSGIKVPEETLTRRKVLKKGLSNLAQFAVGLSLFSGSSISGSMKYQLSEEMVLNYDLEDTLSYGLCDFRNIIIAEGTEKVAKIEKGKIVTIHGAAHAKTAHHYLTHPFMRNKRLLYFLHQLVCDVRVKKFKHNTKRWKLEKIIPF